MRRLVFLVLCITSLNCAGDVFVVKAMSFVGKNGADIDIRESDVTTPFVESANNAVASKINNLLFIELYEALAPIRYAKRFGIKDGIVLDGLSSQSFTVVLNNGRVFSLMFNGESCGAYCEDFTNYYAFDATTGIRLVPDDLFVNSASTVLRDKMIRRKLMLYRRQIASLESTVKRRTGKAKAEDIEELEAKIALNQSCVYHILGEDTHVNAFTRYKYNFNRTDVEIVSERCSNHASRAYDDVGVVTLPISYSELSPYLSAYGKYLLLNEGKQTSDNSIYGKLLTGRIGKTSAITMLLHKYDDDSIHGSYFYNKHRKAIKLAGSESGDELVLNEHVGGVITATMRMKISGAKLSGNWDSNRTQMIMIELTK